MRTTMIQRSVRYRHTAALIAIGFSLGTALVAAPAFAKAKKLTPAAKPTVSKSTTPATLPPLHTFGQKFVDPKGNEVLLQGVNIGGWLVTEGWMCGDKQGDRFLLERLEQRFGEAKAAELMDVWYDNWMTTADLDRIQSYGFNFIRVPFGYRNLQNAAGDWHRNAKGEIDFSRFDWIVNEAGKRGMYVVLDYHIWQGQKEGYSDISLLKSPGDVQRAKAATVWAEVAKHFKGNGTMAAFDLFNEPEGSPGDSLQRPSYEAIRQADPDRICLGEGVWYTNFNDKYWTNAGWSDHYPVDKAAGTVEEKVERWSKAHKVADNPAVPTPVFIGELKAPDDNLQSARELIQAMQARHWSWAVWCYKAVNNGGWASFNYYGDSMRYDSAVDSYDSLKAQWSTRLRQWQDPRQPVNYYTEDWWIDGFRRKVAAR